MFEKSYEQQVEDAARTALSTGDQAQIDAAMQRFMALPVRGLQFCWTHGASHLLTDLWQGGQLEWLKKLHELALAIGTGNGPNGYQDPNGNWNCFERFAHEFIEHSPHEADPKEYGLDADQIDWAALTYCGVGVQLTLRRFPFGSELEKNLFIFSHPAQYDQASYEEGETGYGPDKFWAAVAALREHGASEEQIQQAIKARGPWIETEKRLASLREWGPAEEYAQEIAQLS